MENLSREQHWIKQETWNKVGKGQGRLVCPFCAGDRKNKRDRSLSVEIKEDHIVYQCWHCGETGHVWLQEKTQDTPAKIVAPIKVVAGELSETGLRFLNHRGISTAKAKELGLFSGVRFSRKANAEVETIAFPYRDGDEVYAIKHRCLRLKDYSWEGQPQSLWGIERIDEGSEAPIFVCEGELDAATLHEVGIEGWVSVPHGAPMKVKQGKIDPSDDKKFSYIWNDRSRINNSEKIIICSDNDEPGQALGEEIARRVGKAKCWRPVYPEDCKDINDVLLKHGADEVRRVIEEVEPWPVAGLYDANHYRDAVRDLYKTGPGHGESTGYPVVDDIYTVVQGQVCIVTGIPGSGKSEFIDQLMFNLAKKQEWKFAICSFENPPDFHIPKLAEKYTELPFFEGPSERMSNDQREEALGWINDHFTFIDQQDGEPATIDNILSKASAAVQRLGVRGLVVDPYNYIEIDRSDSETNEISHILTRVRRFAQAHDVHVWFVAHPLKLRAMDGRGIPIPKGYDISGSAAWFAKADMGITVARPWMHKPTPEDEFGNKIHPDQDDSVEVHVWKARFKWMGKVGLAKLEYDRTNGLYTQSLDWGQISQQLRNNTFTPTVIEGGKMPWDE